MMSKFDSTLAHSLVKIQLGQWSIGSVPLTKTQRQSIWDGVVVWILSTSDLLDDYGVDSSRFRADLLRFCHRNVDVQVLMKSLKRACELWRRSEDPSTLHEFVSEFLALEPFSALTPAVIEFSITRSVAIYQVIHHFLTFLNKMPINAVGLETSAIEDYLSSERRLSQLTLDDGILSKLRIILSEWCVDFHPSGFPDHGPGSTADAGSSLDKKMAHLGWDELFLLCPEWNSWFGPDACRSFDRTSKVVLVPKTALSLRTISEEPATLQYWQKPVLNGFLRMFKKSDLRFHVSLEDQSLNGDMAIMASSTGDYSTLDLKAASDSVSLDLVERVFPWECLRYLVSTRSTHTLLPDGTLLPLKKFAPMGSSICFPLECTIFSGLCELVARDHRLTPDERRNAYRVYGDDIIVRNDLVYDLVVCLEACGFIVNETKSFTTNSFRESCGVFAIYGKDITTPALPRDHEAFYAPLQSSNFLRRIDLCNRFLLANMSSARLYVLYSLPKEIPFVYFQPSFLVLGGRTHRELYSQYGIWSLDPPSNFHLRIRKLDLRPLPLRKLTPPPTCLTLPGPVKKTPVNYQRKKRFFFAVSTECFSHKYPDDVRYDWWLRHAVTGRGILDVIQAPFGSRPRNRVRCSWHS
ncbi:TPA_asm: RNA-directed RNA polymerase [ssRNA phage SRR7976300_1]|uniref:RNA-directed RNA polymerase n=1 Tax=ssRNA phage SRR7976300_1 TaxID=2786650 RepID=A0A8S5L0Y0_9VIRU|nr:RNA-directed RNA polymerase [ssRNA phage SRR7976300_1]DAD51095.1 TPA_asm: RNA-directed RNA polymerase [ssRNA phage SRR7976300_1]